jgi:3-polyprenyl-4-hydroxybenzoate decarboxylase
VTDSTVPARPKRIIVGVTGASGAVYPRRLIECLCAADTEVHLVVSPLGRRLFVDELAIHELNDRTCWAARTTGWCCTPTRMSAIRWVAGPPPSTP